MNSRKNLCLLLVAAFFAASVSADGGHGHGHAAPTYPQPTVPSYPQYQPPQTYEQPSYHQEPTYHQPAYHDDRSHATVTYTDLADEGYGAPAPSYHAPTPTYNPPAPAYNPPAPAYNPPAPTYNAPAPAYNPPAPAYNPPAPTYNAPAPAYEAPKTTYHPAKPVQVDTDIAYYAPIYKKHGYGYNAQVQKVGEAAVHQYSSLKTIKGGGYKTEKKGYGGYQTEEHYQNHKPEYKFGYDINGGYTKISAHESRKGYITHGSYSFKQPDGLTRIVDYYVDEWGFHPTVKYVKHH